jgi:ABC-type transport system involved in multi-copper enzyme maturation permease subunit
MLWNLYANESTKLFRRSLYWIGAAVLSVMVVGIFGLFFAVVKLPALSEKLPPGQIEMYAQALTWPASFYTALQFYGTSISLGGLLAFVLVGVVAAQEYPWRTLNLSIGRGTSRTCLLAAKLLAVIVALIGWLAILMLAVGAFTAFTGWQIGGPLGLGGVNVLHLAVSVLRTVYALSPYVALAFCLAIATRSVVAAIGVVAGYAMVVEPLFVQLLSMAGGVLAKIAGWTPMMLASSLMKANDPTGNFISGAIDPATAAAGIAAYAAVLLLAAFLIFRRQDLSS